MGEIIREDLTKICDTSLWADSDHQRKLGMVYENNSQTEILALTGEMLERLNGTFKENEAYRALHNKFYQRYSKEHYWQNLNTPIGQEVLLKLRDIFV